MSTPFSMLQFCIWPFRECLPYTHAKSSGSDIQLRIVVWIALTKTLKYFKWRTKWLNCVRQCFSLFRSSQSRTMQTSLLNIYRVRRHFTFLIYIIDGNDCEKKNKNCACWGSDKTRFHGILFRHIEHYTGDIVAVTDAVMNYSIVTVKPFSLLFGDVLMACDTEY